MSSLAHFLHAWLTMELLKKNDMVDGKQEAIVGAQRHGRSITYTYCSQRMSDMVEGMEPVKEL